MECGALVILAQTPWSTPRSPVTPARGCAHAWRRENCVIVGSKALGAFVGWFGQSRCVLRMRRFDGSPAELSGKHSTRTLDEMVEEIGLDVVTT